MNCVGVNPSAPPRGRLASRARVSTKCGAAGEPRRRWLRFCQPCFSTSALTVEMPILNSRASDRIGWSVSS